MSVCIWSLAIWSSEYQLPIMLPVLFCFVISPGYRLRCLHGVFLCCPFPREMSWMISLTSLSQFLKVFLPTL